MRILSVTAQKPHSTGSGVYLTALVRAFADADHEQAVVGGVYADDTVDFPEGVAWFPVTFGNAELPFSICGMSDEMPYPSTRYRDMTPEMVAQFRSAFLRVMSRAVEEFRPDVILMHHLYLLSAILREAFPDQRIFGLCHGTCLRQLDANPLCRDEIIANVAKLDGFFCLHEEHARRVCARFGVPEEAITIVGSGYNARVFFREKGMPTHNGVRLAYAGKIAEKKGVLSLLRALGLVNIPVDNLQATLAGGFNLRDKPAAEALAEACPFAITMPGPLPQPELAQLLNSSDVFVLPSFYEGLPLVLAEALACGCRVVCTDLPGVRSWMDANVPGNGIRWVAPPAMLDADTPAPESLPAFEVRLAAAIEAACEDAATLGAPACDLTALSWDGVAARIVQRLSAM
ncbi:MAG: glycosyltransferase family 4 protein [Eggerthellaceae bacterium]|nr:glycosyltransferase family 4 protein [Eggerthellaceae bacterium]